MDRDSTVNLRSEDFSDYKSRLYKNLKTVPTLEYIVTAKVVFLLSCQQDPRKMFAINCYSDDESYSDQETLSDYWDDAHSDGEKDAVVGRNGVRKSIEKLEIPDLIRKKLCSLIYSIQDQLRRWAFHHSKKIKIFDSCFQMNYHCVKFLVWKPNAHIHYLETARNMLASKKLNNHQKFILISSYSLENEAYRIPIKMQRYEHNFKDSEYLLKFYWLCFANEKMDEFMKIKPQNKSVPYFIMKNIYNKYALKYFWNQLTNDERFTYVLKIICKHSVKLRLFMLSGLNEFQQKIVFMLLANRISYDQYWSCYEKFLLPMWISSESILKKKRSLDLMKQLVYIEYEDGGLLPIIKSMWKLCSNKLKRYLLKANDKSFLIDLFYLECFELIAIMELDMTSEYKLEFIQSSKFKKICYSEFLIDRSAEMKWIIRTFFRDQELATLFIRDVFHSKKSLKNCIRLVEDKKFSKFKKVLEILFSDQKNTLLQATSNDPSAMEVYPWMRQTRASSDEISFQMIPKFIGEVLPKESEIELKKELTKAVKIFELWLKNLNYDYEESCCSCPTNTLIFVFTRNQLNKSIKNSLWMDKFNSFILWMWIDDEGVREFKSSLNVDRIFYELFEYTVSYYLEEISFERQIMDSFLNWYYESSEESETYKINKIKDPNVLSIMNRLEDQSLREQIIKWFSARNEEIIRLCEAEFGHMCLM